LHILLIIVVLIFVIFLLTRNKASQKQAQLSKKEILIRLCHGNVNKAKRLAELELKKTPGISLEKAIDNAIHFVQRDS